MHTSILLTTITALAGASIEAPLSIRDTSATTIQGPKGAGHFNLEIIALNGVLGLSGNWLLPTHTGAGTNTLSLENDQTIAQKFQFNTTTGDIYTPLGSYPAYLTITTSDLFAPPTGYSCAGFDSDVAPGHGFIFSTPDNYLMFPAANSTDSYTWAVCPAEVEEQDVYIDTLVYRVADGNGAINCIDVMVKAVF